MSIFRRRPVAIGISACIVIFSVVFMIAHGGWETNGSIVQEDTQANMQEEDILIVANQPVEIDTDSLRQLRKNGVEVSTEKDFFIALEVADVIILKKSITLSKEFISLDMLSALLIDEGVTLTITCPNFLPECLIVNLGEILITGGGRMLYYIEPDYSCIGKVSINKNADIGFNTGKIGADEIEYFLGGDLFFNVLNIVPMGNGDLAEILIDSDIAVGNGDLVEILIDRDVTIPAGKTLWLNCNSVLHVKENVTLTNNGTISCTNEPIIDGKIDGYNKLIIEGELYRMN